MMKPFYFYLMLAVQGLKSCFVSFFKFPEGVQQSVKINKNKDYEMLRVTLLNNHRHRTITGVNIRDPKAIAALDAVVDTCNLPHKPAAYWVSPLMMTKLQLKPVQLQQAEGVDAAAKNPLTVPVPASSLRRAKTLVFDTASGSDAQRALTSNNLLVRIQEDVEKTEAPTEDNKEESPMIELTPIRATDNPHKVPHHCNKRGIPFKIFQSTFEGMSCAKQYDSLVWLTPAEIHGLFGAKTNILTPANGVPLNAAMRATSRKKVPTAPSDQQQHDELLFNTDELVRIPAHVQEPLEKYNQLREVDPAATPELETFTKFGVSAESLMGGGGGGAGGGVIGGSGGGVASKQEQITGSGKKLPAHLQEPLRKICASQKHTHRKWYNVSQMNEAHLKPKENELPHEVLDRDGSIFMCFNASQLEFGTLSDQERRDLFRPRLATEDNEARARKHNIFLDALCRRFWKSEYHDALKAAHMYRKDADRASRQYLTQWDVFKLGYDVHSSAMKVSVSTDARGSKVVLYNRDDIVKT